MFILLAIACRPSAANDRNAPDDFRPDACYTIADPDLRNLCRARVKNDSSTCYTIMDPDQRAYCRALTSGGFGSRPGRQ
jgi:hypothetical protein